MAMPVLFVAVLTTIGQWAAMDWLLPRRMNNSLFSVGYVPPAHPMRIRLGYPLEVEEAHISSSETLGR